MRVLWLRGSLVILLNGGFLVSLEDRLLLGESGGEHTLVPNEGGPLLDFLFLEECSLAEHSLVGRSIRIHVSFLLNKMNYYYPTQES